MDKRLINTKILEQGYRDYKKTLGYKNRVKRIVDEIENNYRCIIDTESNLFKKIILWIKMKYEIKKGIDKLQGI